MSKLKVGDRVKVLHPNHARVEIGDVGTVTNVHEYESFTNYQVTVDLPLKGFEGIKWGFTEHDIEPLESQLPTSKTTTLPTDSNERKNYPLFRGLLRYFPAALAGIARTSKLGNDKHNPGEPMYHARGKSMDHGDCILRHLMDVEDLLKAKTTGSEVTDQAVLDEVNQMAWRALAFSQELHERFGAPLAPGADSKIQDLKSNK
jgi:hypothetical protein